MNLKEAKKQAKELSIKQWDRYFHIIEGVNNTYTISRYFEANAKYYFIKGQEYIHI